MSIQINGDALVPVRLMVTKAGTAVTSTNPVEVPIKSIMTAGGITQGAAVPDAAAAPTQAEFNALLTSLRNAGDIAS